MRLQLTDRFCDRAKPQAGQTQSDYFDETVKGLAFRVSPTFKSWTLHYRFGSRQIRQSLGAYPAISLSAARRKALEAKAELADGRDPRSAKADTFQAIAEDYFRREGNGLRSTAHRQSALRRLVYPSLGGRPIGDIRRSDIIRLLDQVEDDSGPTAADNALAVIGRVMNWYASRSDDFRSPIVRGMARTKPKERARDRILTDEELRAVWRQAEANGVFGAFIRFSLLTAARRSEASGMAWTELDGADWTLPAARNKTKVDLVRPLSKAALAVLGELAGPDTPYVFSFDGKAPITGFSEAKRSFDKSLPLPRWTLHDLRRTARSLMSRAGVAKEHGELCLGHVIGGVWGVYDRYQYRDEKALAFEALAALIERIVHPPAENVVRQLARRAK
jgi:integrase